MKKKIESAVLNAYTILEKNIFSERSERITSKLYPINSEIALLANFDWNNEDDSFYLWFDLMGKCQGDFFYDEVLEALCIDSDEGIQKTVDYIFDRIMFFAMMFIKNWKGYEELSWYTTYT